MCLKAAARPYIARDLSLAFGHLLLRLRIGSDLSFLLIVFFICINGPMEGKVRPYESTRTAAKKARFGEEVMAKLVVLPLPLGVRPLEVFDAVVVEDPKSRGDFVDQVVVVCD